MTRKTPYRHKVSSHVRSGVKVSNYERGKGRKLVKPKHRSKKGMNVNYSVTLYFDKGSEKHPVPGPTATAAAKQGINQIQTPEIPRRMKIERVKE